MSRLAGGLLALAGALALAAGAWAQGGAPAPTLHAKRTLVEYGQPVTLTGFARAGERVELEANQFPFRAGYHKLGSAHAAASGSFSMIVRPSHATHYRVLVKRASHAVMSTAISVYVDERVLTLTCSLCTGADPPGPNTLAMAYDAKLPAGKVAVTGPVYFYFGLATGTTPPQKLELAKRVALHRSGRVLSYSVSYPLTFPAGAFQFRVVACFKNAESKDGIGLPGHHHCGQRTLTRREYLGYLG